MVCGPSVVITTLLEHIGTVMELSSLDIVLIYVISLVARKQIVIFNYININFILLDLIYTCPLHAPNTYPLIIIIS